MHEHRSPRQDCWALVRQRDGRAGKTLSVWNLQVHITMPRATTFSGVSKDHLKLSGPDGLVQALTMLRCRGDLYNSSTGWVGTTDSEDPVGMYLTKSSTANLKASWYLQLMAPPPTRLAHIDRATTLTICQYWSVAQAEGSTALATWKTSSVSTKMSDGGDLTYHGVAPASLHERKEALRTQPCASSQQIVHGKVVRWVERYEQALLDHLVKLPQPFGVLLAREHLHVF